LLGTVDTPQAALTNAENMIKKLVEKVGQLEAKLSTITPDDRKSHFYAFVYSERRYCKARYVVVQLCLSVCLSVCYTADLY